jgi:hypothetical protein
MNKTEMTEYAAGIVATLAMKCMEDPDGCESLRFARALVRIYEDRIAVTGESLELFALIGNCAAALALIVNDDIEMDPADMAQKAAKFSVY